MLDPQSFNVFSFVCFPFLFSGWSGFLPLLARTRRPPLSFILLLASCPSPTALVPAGVRIYTRTPYAVVATGNRQPSLPNPQTKQHHDLPLSPSRPVFLSFFMVFLSANKAWQSNRWLNFMLYMIKVANTFYSRGFFFSLLSFPMVFRTADSRQGIWQGQGKAKQSEGFVRGWLGPIRSLRFLVGC